MHFFKEGGPLLEQHAEVLKNFHSMKYLPVYDSIILSLKHFQRFTFHCKFLVNRHH